MLFRYNIFNALLFILMISANNLYAQSPRKIYVSKIGNDINNGSINKPVLTLQRALNMVREIHSKALTTDIQIILRKGIYAQGKPLVFDSLKGGTSKFKVMIKSFPGEKVTISGGESLDIVWVKIKGNIWRAQLKTRYNDISSIRSLFCEGKRLICSNSGALFTSGGLPEFRNSFSRYDFKNIYRLKKDSISSFCGFSIAPEDISKVDTDPSSYVRLSGSWEVSWHKIATVDKGKNIIRLKSPARYPVGFYGQRVKYVLVNSKKYLNTADVWYFDEVEKALYYVSSGQENPNKKKFYISKLENILTIGGSKTAVENIHFSNLTFSYSNSAWGVNTLPNSSKLRDANIDLSQGFTSGQGATGAGQAILLYKAKNCSFNDCTFSFLDGNAIRIGEYSSGNLIVNCSFNQCGSGGIIVGFDDNDPVGRKVKFDASPAYNTVMNNYITNGGQLHPSGIGIMIMQANHNLIKNNIITNMPYTGISCGWTFGSKENFTKANTIEGNVIHDVTLELADGGGIYTLGKQYGAVYKKNLIYNVKRSKEAAGSENNGFFFDESSEGLSVDSNAVYSIDNKTIRFNAADSTKITLGHNDFEKRSQNLSIRSFLRGKLNTAQPLKK